MKKSRTLSVPLTDTETRLGVLYLFAQLFLLPSALALLNQMLPRPLKDAELNFTYFGLNFLAILLIFHNYLVQNLRQLFRHPIHFCQAAVLGFVAVWVSRLLLGYLFAWLVPEFSNMNDTDFQRMAKDDLFLVAAGVIVLVPPVEECLYRGLIFRNLYHKSRWAAYLVSMAVFAFIHILGYLDTATPAQLVLAYLQYLPAGAWLAWSYAKSDTVFTPIVIHAVFNAVGIL